MYACKSRKQQDNRRNELTLDAADAHASTGEGTEGRLRTGAGGLCADTTDSADLDVKGRDADFLAASSDVLSGQHGGVRRRFVTVSLDFHAASDARDGFLAGQVGNVNERVVERGKDAGDAKDEFAIFDLRSERRRDGFLGSLCSFFGCHYSIISTWVKFTEARESKLTGYKSIGSREKARRRFFERALFSGVH